MKMKQYFSTAAIVFAALWSGSTATAQDFKCTSWEAYSLGVKEARVQHTFYRSALKDKNYAEALKYWAPLFEAVTSPVDASVRHFEDGIEIYYELAKANADPAQKNEQLEKMNALYDHKAKCIGESLSDRAYQAYYLYAAQYDPMKTIERYEKLLASGKEKTPYFAVAPIASLTVYYFEKVPKFDKAYMVALYYQLKDICDKNASDKNYQDTWAVIDEEFKKIEDKIFDCDYYSNQIAPAYKANPNDQVKNVEFMQTLKKRCGEENALYVEIKANNQKFKDAELAARWDETFAAASAYEKAQMLEQKGQKSEANEWLEKAFNDPKNGFPADFTNESKGKTAYSIAHRYYQSNSYGTARSWCRRASDLRPNWGEPYILVGIMYASSGSSCGPGTGWDSQAVIWPAMDEWQKARSVDPSCAGEANKHIATYQKYLPTVAEGHFKEIHNGDSYKIGCWINTTTTVRLAK